MDYSEIYRSFMNEIADSIGKSSNELIAWVDYDPIDLDYRALDTLSKIKREKNALLGL